MYSKSTFYKLCSIRDARRRHPYYCKEIFAISTWLIWNRRNASHFGHPSHPLESVNIRAGALLPEFITFQEDDLSLPESAVRHQWRPPEHGTYKVNFDVAVFKSSNSAGIRVIIVIGVAKPSERYLCQCPKHLVGESAPYPITLSHSQLKKHPQSTMFSIVRLR